MLILCFAIQTLIIGLPDNLDNRKREYCHGGSWCFRREDLFDEWLINADPVVVVVDNYLLTKILNNNAFIMILVWWILNVKWIRAVLRQILYWWNPGLSGLGTRCVSSFLTFLLLHLFYKSNIQKWILLFLLKMLIESRINCMKSYSKTAFMFST